MQRKQTYCFRHIILTVLLSCLMLSGAQAAKPLWTFVPQTPTDITVAKGDAAQVIYTVTNQSSKAKTLVMKPIPGINQSALCQLAAKERCTLTLNVNGATLPGDVVGGPVLCQQGNDLQCYQPSSSSMLRIHLTPQPLVQQFTVTPSAGASGSISPATAQVVNAGSSLTFTATPNTGFGINQWLLDGNVVQNGGTTFQLNNIQANHALEVTFNQTTLSPSTQNLALSINAPQANPALLGTPRLIRITNTGSIPANNLQVSTSGFPSGTLITNNSCTGTLNVGSTCNIIITPGSTASPNNSANACTTPPGTEPVPTIVTVSADNAPSTNVNVLVLGYGCIYRGGFLFSVDNSPVNTASIAGKVAALLDEEEGLGDFSFRWADVLANTSADSITNGFTNTNALATPSGVYPAAQACLNKIDQGFTDWFMPAICELGRYLGQGSGINAGCAANSANLYTVLKESNLGVFVDVPYWSSTENSADSVNTAWYQDFSDGTQFVENKGISFRVRCVRAFTP